MRGQVLRTQQTLLLGGDGGKVNRVGRALARLRESPSQSPEDSAAGAIVGGAVVNAVALGVGIDTQWS